MPNKWSPIDELNREVTRQGHRETIIPLVIIVLSVLIIFPLLVALALKYKEEIDAFSMKHPVILAFCFLIPGSILWYWFGKKQNLW